MPINDLIEKHFDATEKQNALQHLANLRQTIQAKLVQLDADERRRYGSVNEDNKQIINKVKLFQSTNPQGSSPDVDWVEFEADYEDRIFLELLALEIRALLYDIESTKMLHDHDNFQAALTDYAYTLYRSEHGGAGAIAKFLELRQFFPRATRSDEKKNNTETE